MGSKYSVGYHGPKGGRDLQGIATLTHDTVALDNIWKDAVKNIEEIKKEIADLTGVPKEAFETGED